MSTFKHAGRVSHGTMRPEDLIPAFLLVLDDLDPCSAQQVWSGDDPKDAAVIACLNVDGSGDSTEDLLSWLFDALESCAPEGYYFGAIEGDGSDYGFWRVEDEDSEDIED